MKTAVITGAAGGMGRAAAGKLIAEGFDVFGLDITAPAPLDRLHFIRTDLTDPDSVTHAFQEIRGTAPSIDCIINMAGIYDLDSLVEISEEDLAAVFQTNLFAAYRINKTFLPLLKKGGRIVIISSELAPLNPLPFTGIYAITKTALDSYARSLQMELQLLGHPVILLRPGAVNTGLLGRSMDALERFCAGTQHYTCNAEKFRRIVSRIETRSISPDVIANIVWKELSARHPRQVRAVNRNPLLLIMNALPGRLQSWLIRKLLQE